MIAECPGCSRRVGSEERIVRIKGRWYPVSCVECHPPGEHETEVVVNDRYFYCTVKREDGEARILSGPFKSYEGAFEDLDRARNLAIKLDPKASFYYYGISSSNVKHASIFKTPI